MSVQFNSLLRVTLCLHREPLNQLLSDGLKHDLDRLGFLLFPDLLDQTRLGNLLAIVAELRAPSGRGGLRGLTQRVPELESWIGTSAIPSLVEQVLGPSYRRVRSLFFDKTPESNWKVPWHQDLTIAVKEKHPVPDFGPWSQKDGVVHVQPPRSIMQQCLTVRIHLDDCSPQNGALRVMAGSHLLDAKVLDWSVSKSETVCALPAGGLLLMRPLLFHASSKSEQPDRRRVVHLEYCAAPLPEPLEWWEEI